MEMFFSPEILLSLLTLTILEIVLGIDNVIFISILAGRLPVEARESARRCGLVGALVTRLGLLCMMASMAKMTAPLFSIADVSVSGKELVMMVGGVFLLWKATREIHEKLEGSLETVTLPRKDRAGFFGVVAQIMLMDLVFSLDSVITAIGLSNLLAVMVTANLLALLVMLMAARGISMFVERHPTVRMLALSFLLLIGFTLVVEGAGVHIPKGYIYFAMAFSILVEILNLKTVHREPALELLDSPPLPRDIP
jgi:predicted tellurium resistance membrane protein TerC